MNQPSASTLRGDSNVRTCHSLSRPFRGLALIIAGLTVPLWMASPGIGVIQAARILQENRWYHWAYGALVPLSAAFMAPVVVLLAVRLYRRRPGPALIGAGAFLLGLVLETVGVLLSLVRFGAAAGGLNAGISAAVAGAMQDDPAWMPLYLTLTDAYQVFELAGVVLVFLGGLTLALSLWRRQWLPSALMLVSTVTFLAALFVPAIWLTALMAASFVVLGLAYGAFGYATARLNNRVEIDPQTGLEVVGQTPRSRRSRRSRRR